MSQKPLPKQPEVNIGTLGHVDNGKSTMVQSLTGIWTAKHSEEMRRGITIRVGYADAAFYKCTNCDTYGTMEICSKCGSSSEFLRAVSFVDCPGHHSLMVTMLSGAALMDGSLFVLSATEKYPQPQDREHLAAAEIVAINKMVIVQNKIDVVDKEKVIENFHEIQRFVKGTIAEKSPIIPISAQRSINMSLLVEAIEKNIPTPARELTKPPLMSIVRSFDVNRPGTSAVKIEGGVIGGSIMQGLFKIGDNVKIVPGVRIEKGAKSYYEPLYTEIVSLHAGGKNVKEATCGGLIGIGTALDPSLTKADNLVGNIVGKSKHLPPIYESLLLDIQLFERAIGTEELTIVEKIKINEPLVINAGTAVTSGIVTALKGGYIELSLRRPICAEAHTRLTLSRRIRESWRLIGHGIIKS
ncbi:MAG: translation initiation factor IF-2 subunit gamma [Candidatus Bathyarchaeota archaeon]|nr:MAG: translation initiation factor IF-2 subunit gamma [Candidatus Bathyarchaeota archaeon]